MYFLQMITQGYFLKFSVYLSKLLRAKHLEYLNASSSPLSPVTATARLTPRSETTRTWYTSEFHPGPLGPLPASLFALNLLCGQNWFPWISVFSDDRIRSGPPEEHS